ncbi:di-N-acetylchitobiase-like [Physella acuta]|uniref:di-N-acetylchitobiase-like n=1 Tax=Physella acuta TaxID=109671 RepID=UPI0027DDE142|nr:di-N-acetylchitobiase-like [Physella acuta]XP_059157760.1 di-N-acetylchitobiase-like [Physella acuta]
MNRCLFFLCLLVIMGEAYSRKKRAQDQCVCSNTESCKHPKKDLGINQEIYGFTYESTKVELWSWDTLTTLIVPSSFNPSNRSHYNTKCVAHDKGRKFGFTVDFNLSGSINSTSTDAISWSSLAFKKWEEWNAEVMVVNLLPYFHSDNSSTKEDHMVLVQILHNLKSQMIQAQNITITLACILPWKPPCTEDDETCYFTSHAADVCDVIILNPDSFTDLDGAKCRARATIPFSKLFYSISDYNSHHVANNRIILGVPWHGYDYKCSEAPKNDICTPVLGETCLLSERERLTYGDIVSNFSAHYAKHDFSEMYMAPYFTYNAGAEYHQVWFEDDRSLVAKYRLVKEFQLRGIALMYGDDLSPHTSINILNNDLFMWSWLSHELLLHKSQQSSNGIQCAETVAGAAVGCLLLGTLLGVTFTCLALRNKVRKPKAPFSRDRNGAVEEFVDEDPNL